METLLQVDFPERLEEAQVSALRGLLPAGPSDTNGVMESDDVEEVHPKKVDDIKEELSSRARIGRGSGAAYDSDEEDDDLPRGQRVQCAQQ